MLEELMRNNKLKKMANNVKCVICETKGIDTPATTEIDLGSDGVIPVCEECKKEGLEFLNTIE